MKHIYYLASPFTHESKKVMQSRVDMAINASIGLLKKGIVVFSPIAYNGNWVHYNLPGSWDFWEKYDKLFITKLDGIIVLQIDGWDKSVGVQAEIEYAKELRLPVFYLTEDQIITGNLAHIKMPKESDAFFNALSICIITAWFLGSLFYCLS